MYREHPLAGLFEPLTPEQTESVLRDAAERYSALTPKDFRRIRREADWGAVRAWIRWILHL